MRELTLASGSPRRRQLLQQLGLEFTVLVPDVDESLLPKEAADRYVQRLAEEKASEVLGRDEVAGNVVLAADTTVVLDGNILGKPASKEEGIWMLESLSGRTHEVLSGVAVGHRHSLSVFCVSTRVTFRDLERYEIEYYWSTGEPADKAGGYGLQGIGAVFVNSLEGSYTNVIGLPLSETVQVLRRFGVDCMATQVDDKILLSG